MQVQDSNKLLIEIQRLRRQLKQPLTVLDISLARKRGECSSRFRFVKAFGSLHVAIAEAGAGSEPLDKMEIEKRRHGGRTYLQSSEGKLAERRRMIQRLKDLSKRLGKPPRVTDIENASAKGQMPSFGAYKRVFGSLQEALRAAKIATSPKGRIDRKTLTRQIKTLGKRLERMPRARDLKLAEPRGEIAPIAEFIREFGSMDNAYEAAGWNIRYRRYSEAEVAEILRELTRRLGRIPRQVDIHRASAAGDFPSTSTIKKWYGSVSDAQRILQLDKIAGETFRKIAPHPYAWAEDEMIESLRELTRRLGRIPRYMDVDEASRRGDAPCTTTLEKRFGSFSKARKKARLNELVIEMPPDWSKHHVKHNKQDVINSLRDLTQYLGRVPTHSDVREASRLCTCPSVSRISRKFDTLEKARRAAGLYEIVRKSDTGSRQTSYKAKGKDYTEGEVIEMLRRLTKRLRHVPTTAEIDEASRRRECPSLRYLNSKFGGIVRVREIARLQEVAPLKHHIPAKYSKKDIIRHLRELTRKLGRWPLQIEINSVDKTGQGPSSNTIRYYFGTFRKACQAARLSEIVSRKRYAREAYTKKEIIDSLRELTRQLGRAPTFTDVSRASKEGFCPGTTTLTTHFGSFVKARRAARVENVLTKGS